MCIIVRIALLCPVRVFDRCRWFGGGRTHSYEVSADFSCAVARQTQLWTARCLARYVSPQLAVLMALCVWGWHECQVHEVQNACCYGSFFVLVLFRAGTAWRFNMGHFFVIVNWYAKPWKLASLVMVVGITLIWCIVVTMPIDVISLCSLYNYSIYYFIVWLVLTCVLTYTIK